MAPPPVLPPLDQAVCRALALLDSLTSPDSRTEAQALRVADLDAAAAICFLESWRAGVGLVVGGGHGIVMAKVCATSGVRERLGRGHRRAPPPSVCVEPWI